MIVHSAEYLYEIYAAIMRRLGGSEEEADIVGRCFVNADLRGKDTQGIAWFPSFYRLVRSGAIRFGTPIQIVEESPAFAVIDGGYGPGQVVGTKAVEIAIEKARRFGVSSAWVRKTGDFGMAANYSMIALQHDCVGIVMSNGTPWVAPWGGREPLFSTSPMSIAIPAGSEKPIVIDMGLSAASHGKVVLAARDRTPLPGPWLVDESGHFTDNPVPLITDPYNRSSAELGAILPLGPKGFGWILLVDILAGVMSGMTTARDIPFNPVGIRKGEGASSDRPQTIGNFIMVIDVGRLMPAAAFKEKVDRIIQSVKSSEPADGFREIVLPGERAAIESERRRREGVPVRDEEWFKLVAIAGEADPNVEALR
jgi:LDH2 family malate/lactate/ureidoglycolate dehydrogenase